MAPDGFQTPRCIPGHKKMYLTTEETEYVYGSVGGGTQVRPVRIGKAVDGSVDVSVGPCGEALTQGVGGHLHEGPSLEEGGVAWHGRC